MSIRKLNPVIESFIALIIIGVCLIALDFYQMSKLKLPKSVDTLPKFEVAMPLPDEVISFEREGLTYIEVIGQLPSFPATPSGKPSYIFDSSGKIVDWCIDTGDADSYWQQWRNKSNIKNMILKEAIDLTEKQHR